MCGFKPGDAVICVKGGRSHYPDLGLIEIVEGRTYTVEAIWFPGEIGPTGLRVGDQPKVQLLEFGLLVSGNNAGFNADRFRKVQHQDLSAWLETAATDTDRWDKPIRAPAPLHPVPSVDALFRRIMAGGDR